MSVLTDPGRDVRFRSRGGAGRSSIDAFELEWHSRSIPVHAESPFRLEEFSEDYVLVLDVRFGDGVISWRKSDYLLVPAAERPSVERLVLGCLVCWGIGATGLDAPDGAVRVVREERVWWRSAGFLRSSPIPQRMEEGLTLANEWVKSGWD